MTSDLTLCTERLVLRRPAPRDQEAIVAFYMSERSAYAGGHVPRFMAWKNTAAIFGHWHLNGFGLWAVTRKCDDTIIGLIGPFYPDGWPETEIGWLIFDGAEGHGFAYEAAVAALADARSRLGWKHIVSYIAPENARSIALADRLGAVLDVNADVPFADKPTHVYRHLPENGGGVEADA
jgi:RimJ/RimL family protein N-acetyltransferase